MVHAAEKLHCLSFFLQDTAADKASLGSGRSFRSSERSFRDDFDSTSVSSAHKRINFGKLIPKLNSSQHRNLSVDSATGSYNIPENVSLEQELEQEETTAAQQHTASTNSSAATVALSRNATQTQTSHSSGLSAHQQQNTQSGSLNPSPEFTVRHTSFVANPSSKLAIASSSNSSSSSSCSSNEAINRAMLIEKPALSTYSDSVCSSGRDAEAAQNQRNESKPLDSPPLSASSLSDSSSHEQPAAAAASAPPKSRTHILRNLFFSLPNSTESNAPTEATVECGQVTVPGTRAKTASAPLTTPLSPSSPSTSSAPSTTLTGPSASTQSWTGLHAFAMANCWLFHGRTIRLPYRASDNICCGVIMHFNFQGPFFSNKHFCYEVSVWLVFVEWERDSVRTFCSEYYNYCPPRASINIFKQKKNKQENA